MESNANTNEAYQPDAAAVSPGNVSSMDDDNDITLCENTLYAQSAPPEPIPGNPPPHDVGNAPGM